MKCVILSAGEITDYKMMSGYIESGDYIIAADGGYRHLKKFGLKCDYCLGDFDSLDSVPDEADEKYPSKKDDTDTMLAVKHGLLKGFDEFVILGGLGGRLDHTFANISALEYLKSHGANGILADENTAVQLCAAGDNVKPMMAGQYFSVFPFGCSQALISMQGVEYPLESHILKSDFPLGVSNMITDIQKFKITIHEGKIIVMECRK